MSSRAQQWPTAQRPVDEPPANLDLESATSAQRSNLQQMEFVSVAPSRVESRLSFGQGGLELSADQLSEHPLAEASADTMPSRNRASGGGNTLPYEPPTDARFDEGHEPLDDTAPQLREKAAEKEKQPPFGWPPPRKYFKWYLRRLVGFDQSRDIFGFFPSWDQGIAFLFTCLTLVVFALIDHYGFRRLGNGTISAFIPAFGASCTVVYGVPKAPIAQPRNVIFAHVSAAIIGAALTNAFRGVSEQPFGQHCAGAIGVGLHLMLMMVTNTIHPPASATVISAATNPINAYYKDEGFFFCLTPVLFGCVVIVVMAWLLNNIFEERGPYPQYW